MSDANIAFVQNLYAAFGRADIATILANVTPDVRWDMTGRPSDYERFGVRKGPAEVQKFFEILGKNEDFTLFEPLSFHAAEDKVFVQGRLALTFKKSDRKAATDWMHVFTLKGGKVAAFKEFLDTAQFAGA